MMCYNYFFLIILIVSLIMLMVFYKYMVIVLLLIELVVLNMILIMGLELLSMDLDFYLIYYVVFSLCESVLGMSMLVLIVRYYSNAMLLYNMFYMLYILYILYIIL